MNRHQKRHRSMRALLFAGVIHLCLAIVFMFAFYVQRPTNIEDAIAVDLITPEKAPKQIRRLKPPPKQLRIPKQTDPSTESSQRHLDLAASANLINETMRQSEAELLHSATKSVADTETALPDVMTDAQPFDSRATPIHKSVASPFQATAGEGVNSPRQRVQGDGAYGFHKLESTGTSDVGMIGDGNGTGEGEGTGNGDGTNPFAEALKNIADHIVSTRELDKVNVVFVLDTSASMRDNIQQVAANLYALTDTFDLVNLEYHLGMSEFSVRREGQTLEVRTLLPDVAMLRRRMQKTTLSGNEHALDALIDTLSYIDFHADADKFIILVTDEAASTAFRKEGAHTMMQEKVIKEYQLQEIRVNVLGHPEPFQPQLAEETGGLWQRIPGDVGNVTTLPSTRAGNQAFAKVFRDIVKDIRRSGGHLLFSMESKFEVQLEDGDIPAKKLERLFKENGISLNIGGSLFNSAKVWEKEKGDLWVITDYANRNTYTIRKAGDKLNVYAGIYPESWNLSENLNALTQQRGNRWLLNDRRGRRMYTIRSEKNQLKVYAGGTPGASPEKGGGTFVDIVVMLDYSRSMGGKSEAIMLGLSNLIGRLDILPIKYRIGLIRFAEAKDAIKVINGAVVTQMPLTESMLASYMEDPFGGDEHLIDAIVDGLPKVKFSPYASRILLILTDEPTTGKYPPERALSVCQSLGVRAYVIGHPRATDFQKTLVQQTGGIFFTMPKHLNKTYPNQ